jgi:hypothetical protein
VVSAPLVVDCGGTNVVEVTAAGASVVVASTLLDVHAERTTAPANTPRMEIRCTAPAYRPLHLKTDTRSSLKPDARHLRPDLLECHVVLVREELVDLDHVDAGNRLDRHCSENVAVRTNRRPCIAVPTFGHLFAHGPAAVAIGTL